MMIMNRREKNIHALSGIQTHGLSVQEIKAFASDRAATGIGAGRWKQTILYTSKTLPEKAIYEVLPL
jgi:hypothetical protein